MSAAEIAQVTRAIAQMKLPQAELRTRRYQPDVRGLRLDMRRTLRGSLRTGGDIVDIHRLGRIDKPAPIVALLDISGSMSEYTRLFLHFLHAITDARKRVSVFLFGTRLTNVTRSLRARDPDEALASCSSTVEDWAGGTRIATSLHSFNKLWGRRVLGQGAIVLLISDGLEREADTKLAFEMDRLHPDCHFAAQFQQIVGPARAGAGRHRAIDLRRAGARGRYKTGVRDGPAAPGLPLRCTVSTNCGAGACWGRAPSCY